MHLLYQKKVSSQLETTVSFLLSEKCVFYFDHCLELLQDLQIIGVEVSSKIP